MSMASGSYIQVYVTCPFYVTDNGKNRLICEGLLPGTQLQNYYRKRKDFKLQTEVFCCRHYDKCEVYRALELKYEEEEQE